MITVWDADGDKLEFEDASKIRTDEHNNLEVIAGKPGEEMLTDVFNRTEWRRVTVDYEN